MLVICHGETPLVNCGPRSILLQYTIYYNHCSLHFLQVTIIFHTIRLMLCFQQAGEIDNLTVLLGQIILVVLCAAFVLDMKSLVLRRAKLRPHHL